MLASIYVVFSVASCKNNGQSNNQQSVDSVPIDTAIVESNTDTISDYVEIPNSDIQAVVSSDFDYMISSLFDDRDTITKQFPLIQKREWNALTYAVDKRKFYLKPILLDTVYWYDDCNGFDMLTIKSRSKQKEHNDNTSRNEIEYIYLTGLDRAIGEIPSLFHTQTTVQPGKRYNFDFNGTKYTLRAEGDHSSESIMTNQPTKNQMGRMDNYFDGCNNYKLYLESDGKVQLLNSDSYSSTCLEIFFIGDLDGDGKPDFLFETNSWYEGSEVTLFLSSKAQNGELVKNMKPSGNYYSC